MKYGIQTLLACWLCISISFSTLWLPDKCADQTFSFLGMNTSAAHNFFHQADSWRMYYWDMSCLSSRDWRVSHMLSHHLHTNTFNDLEVSGIEPFFAFLPSTQKNWLQKYLSHFYIQVHMSVHILYNQNLRFIMCFRQSFMKSILVDFLCHSFFEWILEKGCSNPNPTRGQN